MNIDKHANALFSKTCSLDLTTIKQSANEMRSIVERMLVGKEYHGISPSTTKSFMHYNLLLYPLPGFHNLYQEISSFFKDCHKLCFGETQEQFSSQCWLNVYKKGEYIDWHRHWPKESGGWHGFFCIDTEPDSYTTYRWQQGPQAGKELKIDSKDNLMVIGLSDGDEHRSSEWGHERPRITIAFDILPTKFIYEHSYVKHGSYLNAMKTVPMYTNHWMPI